EARVQARRLQAARELERTFDAHRLKLAIELHDRNKRDTRASSGGHLRLVCTWGGFDRGRGRRGISVFWAVVEVSRVFRFVAHVSGSVVQGLRLAFGVDLIEVDRRLEVQFYQLARQLNLRSAGDQVGRELRRKVGLIRLDRGV